MTPREAHEKAHRTNARFLRGLKRTRRAQPIVKASRRSLAAALRAFREAIQAEWKRVFSDRSCPRCFGTGDVGGNHERVWIICPECEGMGEIED